MAVLWAYRLALAAGAIGARVCWTYNCDLQSWSNTASRFWGELKDPGSDPATLTLVMSNDIAAQTEGTGGALVTDFAEPFELRKLQWRLSRAPAGGTLEDVDVMTFHFIKATAGVAGTYVDGTDLPAVETALGTYWTALQPFYANWMHSDQYRWYKDGPAFYTLATSGPPRYVPIGDNPAIRVTEVDVAGTNATASIASPQTAMTITEKTTSRLHWGRFYLPAPSAGLADASGRIVAANLATILAATVTFYNACRAAQMVPVVWSIQKPERPKKPSGTLPAWPATAFEISSLQMDNLFDVIRSRRYGAPTVKTVTALT